MKCTINSTNFKIFSRALAYLTKIGDEIHIEAFASGLCLSTVNSRKTSYGSVKFEEEFFMDYEDDLGKEDETECRVHVKSILSLFKSFKSLDQCKMKLDNQHDRLIFEFTCSKGLTKRHSIALLEYNHIDQLSIPETYNNKLAASHKIMSGILGNFYKGTREISFNVQNDMIVVENYIDNPNNDHETPRNVYTVRMDEFETFSVKKTGSIEFSFPEFRAMIQFAEAGESCVKLNFDAPGEPLVISCRDQGLYVANLLLATLLHDIEDTTQETIQSSVEQVVEKTKGKKRKADEVSKTRNKRRIISQSDNENPFHFIDSNVDQNNQVASKTPPPVVADGIINEDKSNSQSSGLSDAMPLPEQHRNRNTSIRALTMIPNRVTLDEPQIPEVIPETQSSVGSHVNKTLTPAAASNARPQLVPVLNQKESEEILFDTEDSESQRRLSSRNDVFRLNTIDELILKQNPQYDRPQSPPSTQFLKFRKHLFEKCFKAPFNPMNKTGADVVLAPDSDDEAAL